MAFEVGDTVEVYRKQSREGFSSALPGYRGVIVAISHDLEYGAYAIVRRGMLYKAIKFTYLKHVKE